MKIFSMCIVLCVLILVGGCGEKEPVAPPQFEYAMTGSLDHSLQSADYYFNAGDVRTFGIAVGSILEELEFAVEDETGSQAATAARGLYADLKGMQGVSRFGNTIQKKWQRLGREIRALFKTVEKNRKPEPDDAGSIVRQLDAGFIAVIPLSLPAHENRQVGKTTAFTYKDDFSYPSVLVEIMYAESEGRFSLERSFKNYIIAFTNQTTGKGADETGVEIIDGIPAYWMLLNMPGSTESFRTIMKQYYFLYNGKIYIVGFGASTMETFNANQEIFDTILEQILIIP
ncbi:MAG: hypothetical protein GY765_37735 [bacterium]|nr:hypothetical protein [bacterium]